MFQFHAHSMSMVATVFIVRGILYAHPSILHTRHRVQTAKHVVEIRLPLTIYFLKTKRQNLAGHPQYGAG